MKITCEGLFSKLFRKSKNGRKDSAEFHNEFGPLGSYSSPVMETALECDADFNEPILLLESKAWWAYRSKVYSVKGAPPEMPPQELALHIKHKVLREAKALEKISKEVAAFENFERLPSARRERIPESVRLFVWQRDNGHCVQCASNERLEFDHIIPVVEGGSNTERNVQLLCEACNRKKGRTV
jgi:hypothetical protein